MQFSASQVLSSPYNSQSCQQIDQYLVSFEKIPDQYFNYYEQKAVNTIKGFDFQHSDSHPLSQIIPDFCNLKALSDQTQVFQLYRQYGPSWKLISSKLRNKRMNPKNIFYNSIRRIADMISKHQNISRSRRLVSKQILLSLLQIINQIQSLMREKKMVINWSSSIFSFKSRMLKFCLDPSLNDESQIEQLISLVKILTINFKCFGIFKSRTRRSWKMNDKVFKAIVERSQTMKQNKEKQQINNQSLPNSQAQNQENIEIHQISQLYQLSTMKTQEQCMDSLCLLIGSGQLLPNENQQQKYFDYLLFETHSVIHQISD